MARFKIASARGFHIKNHVKLEQFMGKGKRLRNSKLNARFNFNEIKSDEKNSEMTSVCAPLRVSYLLNYRDRLVGYYGATMLEAMERELMRCEVDLVNPPSDCIYLKATTKPGVGTYLEKNAMIFDENLLHERRQLNFNDYINKITDRFSDIENPKETMRFYFYIIDCFEHLDNFITNKPIETS